MMMREPWSAGSDVLRLQRRHDLVNRVMHRGLNLRAWHDHMNPRNRARRKFGAGWCFDRYQREPPSASTRSGLKVVESEEFERSVSHLRTSVRWPVMAAAAAIVGLSRWVRPP